ncbi:MAG: hypothetical protein CME15_04855, partial [Gemmatimonadetes bacterium]|nr:hypothetical protein [Gemmatimonadota bacterium]
MHFAEDQPLARDAFDAALPPAWPDDLGAQVRAQVRASGRKLVVLDDDPTGGQTVGDLSELLTWDGELLKGALLDDDPSIFVLTNTRSLPRAAAADRL